MGIVEGGKWVGSKPILHLSTEQEARIKCLKLIHQQVAASTDHIER